MNSFEPGMLLWLAAMMAAVTAPYLFFAWRRRSFRYSMRASATIFVVVGLVAALLANDIRHLTEILEEPSNRSKIIWVEVALLLSWLTCLLADGLPVLIRRSAKEDQGK